ncbi:MAG: DUF4430 domain-containing protein [Clostridia bacterium]|nr:DUF4430 domain-containing protein [Clostridia bacterium]
MKKLSALILSVLACCFIAACAVRDPVKVDENSVIITATDSSYDFNGKTLKDFMDYLQEGGKLTYSVNNGMVTSVNGKANTLNSYWMLYTNDTENSNTEWGTVDYEGEVYGSATLGAESLIIKESSTYIWVYQTF